MLNGKYKIEHDEIVNRDTGNAIPLSEPVFPLRASDVHAAKAIRLYARECLRIPHRDACLEVARQFEEYAAENSAAMKEPDTAAPEPAEPESEDQD